MKQEIPYIHLMRVIACILVVTLHCLPNTSYVIEGMDGVFRQIIIYLTHPCVPLFMMITGVLLLPFKDSNVKSFYRKRLSRIIFPLAIWGVIYSILPFLLGIETIAQMKHNLLFLPITYPTEMGGILWYLYILVGIYLIIPFLRPSTFENRYQMLLFIICWIIASGITTLKQYFPFVWGMTPACKFDSFLYFSGYLGYLFLGKYLHEISFKKKRTLLLFFLYVMALCSVYAFKKLTGNYYIDFLHIPILFLSGCSFLLIKNISINTSTKIYTKIKKLSSLTFGIYLSHIVIYRSLTVHLYLLSTSPLMQLLVMVLTFIGAWILTKLISLLPFKKYIIG